MHYFKFNIPGWTLSTAHLDPVEEGVYLRLVNHYYDTEAPIPLETQSVFRRLRLGSYAEIATRILEEFFEKTENGWLHSKCDELLSEYRKTAKKNKKNGKAGGRPRKDAASSETQEKPSGFFDETQDEPKHNLNQEPITINQEPRTNTPPNPPRGEARAQEIFENAETSEPPPPPDQPKKPKPKRFTPPTVDEVRVYCLERENSIDPAAFVNFYAATNWTRGKTKISDWRACVRTWEQRRTENNPSPFRPQPGGNHGRKLSLAERTEQQTRQILAQLEAGEIGDGAMGPNDPAVWPPMDFEGGRQDDRGRALDSEFSAVVPKAGGAYR